MKKVVQGGRPGKSSTGYYSYHSPLPLHEELWRAKAKENKNKLTGLAAAGASRQNRLNQEANNYAKRKHIAWFPFFFAIIAHYEKCRKTALKTLNVATQRGALANAARRVEQHNTLCLEIRHAVFGEKLRRKVCKNE